MQIMASAATEGEHKRKRLPAAAGTPHPLLIVESLWRHVGLQHRLQWSDVDAYLHGGGHGQHLDAVGLQCAALLLLQADAAKLTLTAGRIHRLAGQFLATQPEQFRRFMAASGVVVQGAAQAPAEHVLADQLAAQAAGLFR